MYLEGSFGTIRIGNDDAAGAQMGTAAPYATYFYGINTPFWVGTFSGAESNWHTTFSGANAGDAASLMYFSPSINGFQFGLSYAPEKGIEARSGTASNEVGNELTSIGARYDGAFGDAGVTIAAGYTSFDAEGGPTETDTSLGVVVSMSGVSAGGSFMVTDLDTVGEDDIEQFDVGISYGEGPWTVSLNYGEKNQDSSNLENTYSRLLGNYNLGPGINLAGAVGQDTFENDENTTFAGVAMAISF